MTWNSKDYNKTKQEIQNLLSIDKSSLKWFTDYYDFYFEYQLETYIMPELEAAIDELE